MKGNYEPYYTSHSEADMALANILAFWCAKDYSQMDSIFRQSNLYRDKWDEKRKIQLMVSKHYLKQSMKLITFIP